MNPEKISQLKTSAFALCLLLCRDVSSRAGSTIVRDFLHMFLRQSIGREGHRTSYCWVFVNLNIEQVTRGGCGCGCGDGGGKETKAKYGRPVVSRLPMSVARINQYSRDDCAIRHRNGRENPYLLRLMCLREFGESRGLGIKFWPFRLRFFSFLVPCVGYMFSHPPFRLNMAGYRTQYVHVLQHAFFSIRTALSHGLIVASFLSPSASPSPFVCR